MPPFVIGERIDLEESMTCEFKEVKGQPPVAAIGKVIDEYVVAFLNAKGGSVYWGINDDDRRVVGVRLSDKMRDEVRQVAGQKIGAIAPSVAPDAYGFPFHPVMRAEDGDPVAETFVVQVSVQPVGGNALFLTGSGEAYKRTVGGNKKLSGAELHSALQTQLQQKLEGIGSDQFADGQSLRWMPSVERRAVAVRRLLRGARVLWVDDSPAQNIYERTILSSLGISTELAVSTDDAVYMLDRLRFDLILSDMSRAGHPTAGRELLDLVIRRPHIVPLVFYVARLERSQGTPVGAFGITNRPDELLHYVFDVLERRNAEPR